MDFSPLAELSGIKDLALQCQVDEASCAEVLNSNRHSLQHVKLASCSWDDPIFLAFVLTKLQTLLLALHVLGIVLLTLLKV